MTAILHLNSITCLRQAESWTDEIYVTFNGTKRGLPDIQKGQTKVLGDQFIFTGSPALSLFENDGDHWYDRDDFVDKHTITETTGDFALDFKAESGNAVPGRYTIDVSITPDPPVNLQAILRLTSITCLGQSETISDELYVTFNGAKHALPDMTQGQTKSLSHEFIFSGSPALTLFEDDGNHWYDRDDYIGQHMINRTPGDRTLEFTTTRSNRAYPAHYEIGVNIRPR